MCGIAGVFSIPGRLDSGRLRSLVTDMARQLAHRGPDDEGVWIDERVGLGMGHRRLSVVDLSPTGAQPMASHGGRYMLAMNGEIYNYKELRNELGKGVVFRGTSDTEVLLAAIEQWGLVKTLDKCVGMFALALWDVRDQRLTLARDRMGEKPLYYGFWNGILAFASELRAFSRLPEWEPVLEQRAITLYFQYSYVPAPWSMYERIYKLLPGSTIVFGLDDIRRARTICPWPKSEQPDCVKPVHYWSVAGSPSFNEDHDAPQSDAGAIDALESLLLDSIRMQMVADVPVGALLSGGVDSTTIVALMQKLCVSKVHTFSIGFEDPKFNEAVNARAVADFLGTEHTELYLAPREAMEVLPSISTVYDEPFGDLSQLPTFIVSRLARKNVTVALSGDGGDELFGGYVRYDWANRLWRSTNRWPLGMRTGASKMIRRVSPNNWDRLWTLPQAVLPARYRQAQVGDKLHKLANVLDYRSRSELYRLLTSCWSVPPMTEVSSDRPKSWLDVAGSAREDEDFVEKMMRWDMISYLPDDILVKIDRAAMSVSLEGRTPMLDHRLVEFALRLPRHMKIRHGRGKWILRQVMNRHVPVALTERPKTGFVPPVGEWLRGPLRDWAEALLFDNKASNEMQIDHGVVKHAWDEHISGRRNLQYRLWNVLMLKAWQDGELSRSVEGSPSEVERVVIR